MRPKNLNTLIYLDGCDSKETSFVKKELGFLDGQTTNPTLFSKNKEVAERVASGNKYSSVELIERYKQEVLEIDAIIGGGSVSVEVYADLGSSVESLVAQGIEFAKLSHNVHVKLPATKNGLLAMKELLELGIKVNITLCFSQDQAAAVYSQSRGHDNVYVSPFIGRLDGIGLSGFDLIKNIDSMYKKGDGHVQILAASIRDLAAFQKVLFWGIDIVTAPKDILLEWKETGFMIPKVIEEKSDLTPIEYKSLSLSSNLDSYNLDHELTDKGLLKFVEDWSSLIR